MKIIFFVLDIFDVMIIYLCGLYVQEMSNKNIVYGVRVPVGEEKSEVIQRFKKKYKKNFSFTMLAALIIHELIFVFTNKLLAFQMTSFLFLCVALMFFNYYAINKEIRSYKKTAGWKFESNKVIVVDTNYRKTNAKEGKTVLSDWWYLIPLAMVAINIIALAVNYNSIPERIAAHMDFSGNVDRWETKSFLNVYMLPIISLIMTLMMLVSNRFIRNAKQNLNSGVIFQIKFNSRRERYYQSLILWITNIFVDAVFFFISLQTVNILKLSSGAFIGIMVIAFLPVVISIVLSFIARKEKTIEVKEDKPIIVDRDDDANYIWGMIYYNPDDPSTFIEKRAGFGITFNYAKTGPIIFTVIMGIIVFGTLILLLFAS